jgi:hypothetical protein
MFLPQFVIGIRAPRALEIPNKIYYHYHNHPSRAGYVFLGYTNSRRKENIIQAAES